jgi:hypothetical protein
MAFAIAAEPGRAGEEAAPPDPSPPTVLAPLPCCDAAPSWAGFYGDQDFLLWQMKSTPVAAPLLTLASFADPLPGAIGQAGTRVLFGNKPINTGMQGGSRTILGYRWDSGLGVELGYFLTQNDDIRTLATSGQPGSPNFAVPVFDVSGVSGLNRIPGQSIFVLPGPYPGSLVGSPAAQVPAFRGAFFLTVSNQLQGSEVNLSSRLGECGKFRFDGIAGFRWVELRERLTYSLETAGVPGSVVDGAFVNARDSFATQNDFYGGQVGLRSTYESGRWCCSAFAKVAIGGVHQAATVAGQAQASNGNLFLQTKGTANTMLPTGVFAEPSNSGSFSRDQFTVIPEFTFNAGCRVTERIRVFVGYNFLLLGSVMRPGDQIDANINVTRTGLAAASRATVGTGTGPIPFGMPGAAPPPSGPIAPVFPFKATDVWVQGINFGISADY